MKQLFIATAVALACGAALAQTPATKAVEQNAVPTAPRTAAAAEAKEDARQKANPSASTNTGTNKAPETGAVVTNGKAMAKGEMNADARRAGDSSDMKMVMDTNGDGMISRKEYDAYHANMWKSMKANKGMVPQADMQKMLKQGLGGM